ncbi:head-tail joining protein [Pseudomonas schmalbachii]|uniref:Uncharacterized protein n=1 Tax=Pseudomonas schmalbachii TaxID=2816993 RepID=A0ABS3TL50_9PSED|nr:hypothetical protein [Pseudomonas schmalbachii]MBO3274133.1 hypothetical protein [Pseudomonas schmalbachii]
MTWQQMADRMLGVALRTFDEVETHEVAYFVGGVGEGVRLPWAVFDKAHLVIDPETQAVVSSTNPALGVRLQDMPGMPTRRDTVRVRDVLYRIDDVQQDGVSGAVLILRRA